METTTKNESKNYENSYGKEATKKSNQNEIMKLINWLPKSNNIQQDLNSHHFNFQNSKKYSLLTIEQKTKLNRFLSKLNSDLRKHSTTYLPDNISIKIIYKLKLAY